MANIIDASPAVIDCDFIGNSANDWRGGGMFNFSNCSPSVTGCTFRENTCGDDGAGMANQGNSSPTVTNCIFVGNTASTTQGGGGGMINLFTSNPTVTNCTFSDNLAEGGGAIYNWSSTPTLFNCILWDDSPDEIDDNGSAATVRYSDIQGGWYGVGNINANPLFVDPADDDYHLSPGSPCIDAGSNTYVPAGVTTDLDGNPRFVDDPDTVDTGYGTPPIVDMGAYEFQGEICFGDLDGDGVIGLSDLAQLLSNYGTPSGAAHEDGDLDADGDVDLADLAALLAVYGTTCE
jgi:hypothetical protein